MTFDELRTVLRSIPGQIKSDAVAFYFEAVFEQQQLEIVQQHLETYFGKPFKLSGMEPTPESDKISGRYGGASTLQTLYACPGEKGEDVALLWPWQAGTSFTLKLVRPT